MERPFQFSDDRAGAHSPFNQQLLSPTVPPPTSFKTNVNRSKTRKWAEAKNYSYDGDDWGGYDPYDEYGSYDNPDPPLSQSHPHTQPQPQPQEPRRNSFEAGDESTVFSSGVTSQSPPPPSHTTPTKAHDGRALRRDFSQIAHVPPPLQTRTSPSAARDSFPARKSSLPSSPAQKSKTNDDLSSSPSSRPATAEKPLPFIRPADIYKRLEEERQKERGSEESSRPSVASPVETNTTPSVPERHTEEHPGFTVDDPVLAQAIGAQVASHEPSSEDAAPADVALPKVSRVASTFGDEFWNASELPKPDPSESADAKDLQHQPSLGFRSVVNHAFDRQDDSSVPPTPISRDNSQSHGGSETSGISPIMSRVPSAATAEAKVRAAEGREAVPPIAEESSLPGSRRSSQQQSIVRKPSPAHSRKVSAEAGPASFAQGYRRELDTPSPNNSPAKTPILEFTKRLSSPMVAESTTDGDILDINSPSEGQSTGSFPVGAPVADYSRRESDIAAQVSSSSPDEASGVAQAAQVARSQFLQTHSAADSPSAINPASRSASPIGRHGSPGPSRVRDLAGKYNELHQISRSNSAMSLNSLKSKNSDMSLNRTGTFESNYSEDMESPVRGRPSKSEEVPSRPEPPRGFSFRPHLPGEWVSYISTPQHPETVASDQPTVAEPEIGTPTGERTPSVEDIDLTPSTVKHPLAHRDVTPRESNPIHAVKAAGDALGSALLSSVGLNHETRDFAQREPEPSPDEPTKHGDSMRRPSVGDIYLRPLAVERTASSVASSVAPTPPPKDTPKEFDALESPGYFPATIARVDSDAFSPSSEYETEDLESDRLRREIEMTLAPPTSTELEEQRTRDQDALDAPSNLHEIQKSEGLLRESEASPQTSSATANEAKRVSFAADPIAQTSPNSKPGLLDKRFSWEQDQGSSGLLNSIAVTEPQAAYERPRSSAGLHIVNTDPSIDSDDSSDRAGPLSLADPIPVEEQDDPTADESVLSPISPVTSPDLPAVPFVQNGLSGASALDPMTSERSTDEPPLPSLPSEGEATSTPSAPSGSASRIPPFREILALRSANERIDTYNSTRDQFASMDTGLQNWLSTTLSSHPEHAHITTDAPTKLSSENIRHKHQPSIMKIAKGLGSSSREVSGSHAADSETPAGVERQNSQARSPSAHHGGVERMQTKGKDLLHSAGMLGGKATFGAKGLFAKAKGKLREGGSEKASDRTISPSAPALSTPTNASISDMSQAPIETSSNKVGEGKTRSRSGSRNRFSTAFTRFRPGSFSRPQSRPTSIIFSQNECPTLITSQENVPSPGILSNGGQAIAPWAEETEDAEEAKNGRLDRIGLLPSPAYGGSTKSQDDVKEAEDAHVNDEKGGALELAKDRPQEEQAGIQDNEQIDAVVVSPAIERGLHLLSKDISDAKAEPRSPAIEPDSDLPVLDATSPRDLVEKETISTEEPPRHMLQTPSQNVPAMQPVSNRSSISSMGANRDSVPEASKAFNNAATAFPERDVSPMPASSSPKQHDSVSGLVSGSREKPQQLPRPALIGRSSLPSQQRPQEHRQSSWTWRAGSRTSSRTSLALVDTQASASATPLRKRAASASGYQGLGQASRAVSPVSFMEEEALGYKPKKSQLNTEAGATRNVSPIDPSPQNLTTAGTPYEYRQPSPAPFVFFPSEPEQSRQPEPINPYQAGVVPISEAEEHEVTGVQHFNQNESNGRSFSPAIMDPRQHLVEYQLPGVGPPEDVRTSRGVRGFFRSPVTSPAPPERINPAAVAFVNERTFSGDIIQTQAAQEKKEKRRSSVFGAFSRNSSISGLSGLSDGRQSRGDIGSRGNSRGNMSAVTVDAQAQGSDPAWNAAQRARENPGKGNTLRKVQRSSTTAGKPVAEPEKNQKRFSRLGSIFGRSKSEARKTNKLVKTMPKSQTSLIPENVGGQSQRLPQDIPPLPAHYSSGVVAEPDAHESQWQNDADSNGVPPPPGGWYAPISRRSSYSSEQQLMMAQQQQQSVEAGQSWQATQQQQPLLPSPSTRRLHSEGFRHGPRYTPGDYRTMSPSQGLPERPSQHFEQNIPPYRTPSTGPTRPTAFTQRQLSGGPLPRNFSWSSQMATEAPQQQQQPYGAASESPERRRYNASPNITPSHSRNTSSGSAVGTPPAQGFRGNGGALQRASSPALYGQTQPYYLPPPESPVKLQQQQQQQWYANYAVSAGPPQQPSSPAMYAGTRPPLYNGWSTNVSRHNSISAGGGGGEYFGHHYQQQQREQYGQPQQYGSYGQQQQQRYGTPPQRSGTVRYYHGRGSRYGDESRGSFGYPAGQTEYSQF